MGLSDDIERLRKLSAEKNQFILDRLESFEKIINSSALSLSDRIIKEFLSKLDAESGQLKNTTDNIRRISTLEQVWQKFQDREGVRIITAFVADLSEIVRLGGEYYSELIPDQVASDRVEQIINEKLGLTWDGNKWSPKPNGYIASLIKDRTIITDIKRIAFDNILAKTGPEQLRKSLNNYIIGQDQEPGDFYKFFKQFTFDTYSNVDRLNSKLHADRLDLQFFLYNGGLVRDSREFCKERHGKCFSTDEAEEWRKLIGKLRMVPGKRKKQIKLPIGPIVDDPATYDPVRDLGGIQCRHSADFISNEIAEKIRGDL